MKTFIFLVSVILILVGCGGSGSIAEVTPIVLDSAEITSSATVVPPAPADPTAPAKPLVLNPNAPSVPPQDISDTIPTPEGGMMSMLPRGQALQMAYENDLEWEVIAPNPIEFDEDPVPLTFNEFFIDFDPYSTEPPDLSDKLLSLDGKRVIIEGYMSPPLQLGLDWFMLTQFPLAACPFHSSTASITPDIALIYVRGSEIPYTYLPVRLEGEVQIGGAVDSETGMVSLVRIYADEKDVDILSLKDLLDS